MAFSAAAAALAELRLTVSPALPFCCCRYQYQPLSFQVFLLVWSGCAPFPHARLFVSCLTHGHPKPQGFPPLARVFLDVGEVISTYRPLSELDLARLAAALSKDSLILLERATERTRGNRDVAVVAVL